MSKQPNPQGKGMIPVMDSLLACRVRIDIPPKSFDQVACELFTSLFILNSEFKYKPVIGYSYWLYRKKNVFRLSLIEPQEWSNNSFGLFVGECVMQEDMTWSFTLSKEASEDKQLIKYIECERQKFEKNLTNQHRLKQALPIYNAKLPFYQRVLASGLAYSLGISLDKQLAVERDFRTRFLKNNG